jgi:hypothetical protein
MLTLVQAAIQNDMGLINIDSHERNELQINYPLLRLRIENTILYDKSSELNEMYAPKLIVSYVNLWRVSDIQIRNSAHFLRYV